MSTANAKVDSVQSCEQLQNILIRLPVVTDVILAFLPARALNTAAQVCTAWADSARRVRRRRRHHASFFLGQVRTESVSSDLHAAFADFRYDFLDSLSCEPKHVLVFSTPDLIEGKGALYPPLRPGADGRTHARRKRECFVNYVDRLLPRSTRVLGIAASGIIGTDHRDLKTFEFEEDSAFSCLCLPTIPGLQVHYLHLHSDVETMFSRRPSWLTSDPDIKCLLVFHDSDEEEDINIISKSMRGDLWWRLGGNVVVAGGHVDCLHAPRGDPASAAAREEEDRQCNLMVVGISGANVHAASVVVPASAQTPAAAEAAVARLKRAAVVPDARCSFAFMFACVGRGSYMFRDRDVESAAFRKHFPNVPLVGFFGNGEIGHEHLGVSGDGDAPRLPRLDHTYSTIFVLVSVENQ
ncbi:PREDICTED: F-box only protein 22-like [Priapulus caudatus]|uniref:F-box only protein 22-like n=1 Tax=Priapulus caudatus TaxID=37621 RepID=A0ABM1E1I7_PRICU|nr:PREDICTED: F-box only protein 22-like [Priapulus caudatus]